MKKLLAVVLTFYILAISFVVVAGFIQKQSKEDDATPQSPATLQTGASTSKAYSTTVISQHRDQSSCWLIINNKVYDVTSFLSEHPGGAGTIIPYCGREATRAFDTKDQSFGGGHSSGATSLLQDYVIGSIAP